MQDFQLRQNVKVAGKSFILNMKNNRGDNEYMISRRFTVKVESSDIEAQDVGDKDIIFLGCDINEEMIYTINFLYKSNDEAKGFTIRIGDTYVQIIDKNTLGILVQLDSETRKALIKRTLKAALKASEFLVQLH